MRQQRKGIALPYALILIIALSAIASLAVDLGRVFLVKAQLRATADAAALAGGQLLLSDPAAARAAAIDTAKANQANGAPVTLDPTADIEFVYWNDTTRTYQPATTSQPANAVRVVAHCSAARGTAIDLPFAKLLGKDSCDAQGAAIALASPQRYAAIGLDYITLSGTATNAYRAGTNSGFTDHGDIASNGNITLSGGSLIQGNAFPGVGMQVKGGTTHVTGYTTPLSHPLLYPRGTAGDAATNNNNGAIPSWCLKNNSIVLSGGQSVQIQGGTYYLNSITISGSSTITFTGPAKVYLTGNLTLSGSTNTNGNLPRNLSIVLLNPSTKLSLSGSSYIYADLYAPLSPIDISGSTQIFGSLVGKSLTISGSSSIHKDLSLKGGVYLVK